MIQQWLADPIARGVAQALMTGVLAIVVLLVCRWQRVHLERETLVALARGIVQIVIVGASLTLLLGGPIWTGALILLAMIGAAAAITARRVRRRVAGAWQIALLSIGLGSGAVIALMTLLGVIGTGVNGLVPVGSIIIASAQVTSAQTLERFAADVAAHVGQVEAALALGATPADSVAPYTQAAVAASMIPRIDSINALGIVWIPGLMAGIVLAGGNPIYAALYQFGTLAMIYAACGLTGLISMALIRRRVFSAAEQLLLRP